MKTFDAVTVTLNPAVDLTVSIPGFTAGSVNRVASMRTDAGGKGVNVAAALADHGHHVAATGLLGRENSAIFEALFKKKGITDHFTRIEGATRFGLKITDPIQGGTTDINFPGLSPSSAELDGFQGIFESMDASWYVLAGSLSPAFPLSYYADLISKLKAGGKRVALDASGEPLRRAVAAKPDLIKPNIFELEMMLGTVFTDEQKILEAARSLVQEGVGTVVVSMGEKGALFVSKDEAIQAVPPEIKPQSTVGAGDAMVAGMISARLAGLSLEDSARRATAFSLDALGHLGSGLSSRESVRTLAAKVAIKRI